MATPKEVDLAASSIHAELWHGELCYELSEMEQERTFPMSDEGRAAMQQWLEENIRAKGYLKRSGAAALRSGPIFPERIL